MSTVAPARDLERRKQVRLSLRADILVEAQRYEGRTFYVLKDPVSLRYYRLKENEQYLLQFLDGKHTLEEAQKAYEKRYRPERLKLEDLEAFGQQLLNAGLAHNESPRAGQQLFEQRSKRLRSEWMQTLTNILYIKIPLLDPDHLLAGMLKFFRGFADFMTGPFFLFLSVLTLCGFSLFLTTMLDTGNQVLRPGFPAALLFSAALIPWVVVGIWKVVHAFGLRGYLFLSLLLKLSAGALVLTHFDTFRAKLPSYHEFFSFKTVVYLWVALAVVKVIHEFGHGLSCKLFGGEVHELGLLFLCFSPAMYCNVSDAWKMPNKWHRIVISYAGIFVELCIASIATFVWWNTPGSPFVNNLALSLMVVCSVSTVVFNGNPLMRYDGYYILADWLEIPNLREKANRYLTNLFLEHCLGIEVQPEPYMDLWRRILFLTFAVVSYVYKWVVTFTILYFMYNFLKPYKLQVVSGLLTLAAVASMIGWPAYRMGKNIHRRGRLPDMKPWRVRATVAVAVGLVLFAWFVPVPISRIRATGLVEAHPDATRKVYVRHPGTLTALNVRDGESVPKGYELARFENRDLDRELESARTDRATARAELELKAGLLSNSTDQNQRVQLQEDIVKLQSDRDKADEKVKALEKTRDEELILRAPEAGVVRGAPRIEDIGKYFEKDPTQPFCTVTEPRRLRVCLPVETAEFNRIREEAEEESDAARRTRRQLQRTVSVHYEGKPLGEVLDDLGRLAAGKGEPVTVVKGDDLSPALQREPVSARFDNQRVSFVLERVLEKYGLGYVVLSEAGARNGALLVRAGHERGYPEGGRPLKDLRVTIRVQGRDSKTWQGRLARLPESDAKVIPLALSNKAGGPVAVKPGGNPNALQPQTQYYLVYIDILDPDDAITPGNFAQVKVHCKPETCVSWAWRKLNSLLDLGLL